jgi:hypothetical protein
MSEPITCICGETYFDAECFVAHYHECQQVSRVAPVAWTCTAKSVLGTYRTYGREREEAQLKMETDNGFYSYTTEPLYLHPGNQENTHD